MLTKESLVGKTFNDLKVIGESENPAYVKCECTLCGNVLDVKKEYLVYNVTKRCRSCAAKIARQKQLENFLQRQKEEYTSKVVNGWKVVDVFRAPDNRGRNRIVCTAICPKCGQMQTLEIANLKRSAMCAHCSSSMMPVSKAIRSVVVVGGSNLMAAKSRLDGKVNCNSTTGYNGVTKHRDRYCAYIQFRGQRVFLGSYLTIEEAAAARKAADEIMLGPYLARYEGWEQDLTDALAKLREQSKRKHDSPNSSPTKETGNQLPQDTSAGLAGKTFGKWLVLGPSKNASRYCECVCQGCGTIKDVYRNDLILGKSRSCHKCAASDKAAKKRKKQTKKEESQ